jgi:hypothetical protein
MCGVSPPVDGVFIAVAFRGVSSFSPSVEWARLSCFKFLMNEREVNREKYHAHPPPKVRKGEIGGQKRNKKRG